MFLVIGGLLVISGMVLNTLISGDAEAQVGFKDGGFFKHVFCNSITIVDESGKFRGTFGFNSKKRF